MRYHCSSCGKALDCKKSDECWSDNQNALTHPHLGGLQCRDCYAKTHSFCRQCKDRPFGDGWLYCPWCGAAK